MMKSVSNSAVQLSYGSNRTVRSNANGRENVLYRWRKRYTPAGDVTQAAEREDELQEAVKKVNDMYKKFGLRCPKSNLRKTAAV